jgi:hypothetical protein
VNHQQTLHAVPGSPGPVAHWGIPLGPGRWHVLFPEEKPLLVPTDPRASQWRHLTVFLNRWQILRAQALLKLESLFPRAGLLPEFHSKEGGHASFLDRLPHSAPPLTLIQIGWTGPNQSAALLLVAETGESIALAKVAMVPTADKLLAAEAGWLRELESATELDHLVPRLVAEGVASNGRRYLVTSLAPNNRTTTAFTPAHAAFLGALGHAGQEVMSFAASPCLQYLEQTGDRLLQHVPRGARAELQAARHDCRTWLGGWTGPFVSAHGDFVPENIRLDEERIFVFDWEDARHHANPLGDALDYLLRQRALSRGGASPVFLAATLRRVKEIAQQLYPEWTWRPRAVSALCLAHLLETVLRCTAAHGVGRSHRLAAAYFRLVEQRSAWMMP